MTSSTLTVVVLAVLWLVVVVPMIVRRKDERAPERSVAKFGRTMRVLARRQASAEAGPALSATGHDLGGRPVAADVFVPRSETVVQPAARRPVPAAREALMHPVDRSEMSAARQQMMSRRRRSLTILGLGSVITLAAAFIAGGVLAWSLALAFLALLGGYLLFLRNQAARDRDRREARLRRLDRSAGDWDATDDSERADRDDAHEKFGSFRAPIETTVRIDDDDIELHVMDTVDLTGLYAADDADDFAPAQRRAG